jgi:hypothetical protein
MPPQDGRQDCDQTLIDVPDHRTGGYARDSEPVGQRGRVNRALLAISATPLPHRRSRVFVPTHALLQGAARLLGRRAGLNEQSARGPRSREDPLAGGRSADRGGNPVASKAGANSMTSVRQAPTDKADYRPHMPNSGRSASAYLFAALYLRSVAVIVISVVRFGSRAALNAEYEYRPNR